MSEIPERPEENTPEKREDAAREKQRKGLLGHIKGLIKGISGKEARSPDEEAAEALATKHPELKALLDAKRGDKLTIKGKPNFLVLSRKGDLINVSIGNHNRIANLSVLELMNQLVSDKETRPAESRQEREAEYPTDTELDAINTSKLAGGTIIALTTGSGSQYRFMVTNSWDQDQHRGVQLVSQEDKYGRALDVFNRESTYYIQHEEIKKGKKVEFVGGGSTSAIANVVIEK